MIIITLPIHSTSISLIFLPLFSSVMFPRHPTEIGLPNMFALSSNLEYRTASPLLKKMFSGLALSSYLLARLLGLIVLAAIF